MSRVALLTPAPAFSSVAKGGRPAISTPGTLLSTAVRQVSWRAQVALIAFTVVSAACERSPAIAEATRDDYQQRCAVCHGSRGDGGGPEAASLPVSIPDWTSSSWQDNVADEWIGAAIAGGGEAVGKSAAMPPFPDLADSKRLADMTALIRSFEH